MQRDFVITTTWPVQSNIHCDLDSTVRMMHCDSDSTMKQIYTPMRWIDYDGHDSTANGYRVTDSAKKKKGKKKRKKDVAWLWQRCQALDPDFERTANGCRVTNSTTKLIQHDCQCYQTGWPWLWQYYQLMQSDFNIIIKLMQLGCHCRQTDVALLLQHNQTDRCWLSIEFYRLMQLDFDGTFKLMKGDWHCRQTDAVLLWQHYETDWYWLWQFYQLMQLKFTVLTN